MENFNNTLTLLDKLINRLEANTGGQVYHQSKSNVKEQNVQNKTNIQVKDNNEEVKKQVKQKVQQINKQVQKKVKQINKEVEKKVQQKQEKPKKEKKEKKQKKQKKQKKLQQGQQQKKQQKQPKKEEKKKQPGQVGVQDFALIDIRIGQLVDVWKHPQSQKLYCQKINVAQEIRQIASGLQQFIPIDQMVGLVIVMANLKARPLGGFPSNGMVVCASNEKHTQIELIHPKGEINQRVYLQGYQQIFKGGAILPVLNPKKKVLQKCLPLFKTDEQGFVTWKGIKVKTSGGYLRSKFNNGVVS